MTSVEWVNAILDPAPRGTDQIKADPSLLTEQRADPYRGANRVSKEYGLVVCGQGG